MTAENSPQIAGSSKTPSVNDDERSEEQTSTAAAEATEAAEGTIRKRSHHERSEDKPGNPAASQRAVKKMKRAKYISRACTLCQQRKIKCEGGEPCAQCVAKNRPCVSIPRATKFGDDERAQPFSSSGQGSGMNSSTSNISSLEVLTRLAEVERQLRTMPQANQDFIVGKNQGHPVTVEDQSTPIAMELQDVLECGGQTFAGEISMGTNFKHIDEGVDSASGTNVNLDSNFSSTTPPQSTNAPGGRTTRKVRAWLETVLDQYGVVADEAEWRHHLQIFFDDIHILYPILHPPTIWETFNEVWEYSVLWSLASAAEREYKQMSVALLCFCLALGRCSASRRMTDANGVHSAGWSFYRVGISLLQDTIKMSNTTYKSLLTLQVLVMRVLYLFRLDSTERAARLLALSISNAHIIGLHRQSTYDKMPVFQSQMFCRTWWAIYVMDRRLAIESGRPYVIQDNNTDTGFPLQLGNEWMSRYQSHPGTTSGLSEEISLEISTTSITPLSYFIAIVRLSRVVGKVWEVLYSVKVSVQTSTVMIEYADTALCNLLEALPDSLSYNPDLPPDAQFRTRPTWQVKQTMLLFIRTTFLRVIIRRPFYSSAKPSGCSEDDELESLTICASLAARILAAHEIIQHKGVKNTFPFSHCLTSTTMVMIAIIMRDPSLKKRYWSVPLAATRSLNLYCHSNWVSGKMIRHVSRLASLAQRLLVETVSANRCQKNAQDLEQEARLDHRQQVTSQSDTIEIAQSTGGTSGHADAPRNFRGTGRRDSMFSRGSDCNTLPPGGAKEKPNIDGSTWWAERPDAPCAEIPDWAMPDFNLEAVITEEGMGSNMFQVGTPEDGRLGMRTGAMITGLDVDGADSGTVAPNRLFGLDLDVEQSIMSLCNWIGPSL
ncbi:fungal-specific transcription factor domain-containing protein [Dactylonectria macrodidyma]|uniref:Fungal-specific transcription factor domain-containing protein n=1 Tax=Dactylonectria macrodidyma TaxID=307937 RepID=A0A9P9D8N9_9HYPO|nr:fungal-specific transcription factor domain-containing protein [Dactylonectria macrodidyma]